MSEPTPLKRKPGRPRKAPELSADALKSVVDKPERKQLKMKAKPNWETFDASTDESPDRLRINPDRIPEGMSAQWVTTSVYGQPLPQHRADFERKGWTPVHQEDFDGVFDGMFMPKGAPGEIVVEGMVLMMRPKEYTDKARNHEYRKAREQVFIKEQALRGGDMPVSLDARHASALSTNRITKTVERIQIPED